MCAVCVVFVVTVDSNTCICELWASTHAVPNACTHNHRHISMCATAVTHIVAKYHQHIIITVSVVSEAHSLALRSPFLLNIIVYTVCLVWFKFLGEKFKVNRTKINHNQSRPHTNNTDQSSYLWIKLIKYRIRTL